jgi:predicted transcriptional regulator of viral defense system
MKKKAVDIFRAKGGQLRMHEAIKHGISRYMLYTLRDQGVISQVSRGGYRLVELPPIGHPDLVTIGLRLPKAVICLVSALAFHELTTQVPHQVSIALPRGSRRPVIDSPPIMMHRFSEPSFRKGVEMHSIDGVPVKIFSIEKTLADCFKFRNKVGMDVVLEALKLYKARKKLDLNLVLHYAKICRVDRVMKPYLEGIL